MLTLSLKSRAPHEKMPIYIKGVMNSLGQSGPGNPVLRARSECEGKIAADYTSYNQLEQEKGWTEFTDRRYPNPIL